MLEFRLTLLDGSAIFRANWSTLRNPSLRKRSAIVRPTQRQPFQRTFGVIFISTTEVAMTPDELRELLLQNEGLKLDFKREYQINKKAPEDFSGEEWAKLRDGQRDELIKDILALTNGNVGTHNQPAHLIIGAEDDKRRQPDGTRPLFDVTHLELERTFLISLVNGACQPPLPDLECEKIEIDGTTLIAITIPPSLQVHSTSRVLTPRSRSFDATTGNASVREKRDIPKGTFFLRSHEGTYWGSQVEVRALSGEKSPLPVVLQSEVIRLNDYVVPLAERQKVQSIFAPPSSWQRPQEILGARGKVWIVGPPDTWKRYLAVWLAPQQSSQREIYSFPKVVDWDQLAMSGIRDSVIIFPDAIGHNQYETKKVDTELRPWNKLHLDRNLIIATSSESVFIDAENDTRLGEWIPHEERFFLNSNAYDYRTKIEIFKRLLQYAFAKGTINERQKEWTLSLVTKRDERRQDKDSDQRAWARSQTEKLLNEVWLPGNIESFIFEILPKATHEGRVFEMLRNYANAEARIQSWFFGLEESVRCLLLTLSIFSGFKDNQLWAWHRKIVERLRRLNGDLDLLPLGILRQLARPYVTADGPIEFVDPAVFQMVKSELSRNYREYFVEILDLLREWSIPEGLVTAKSKDEVDRLIRDSEDVRNAIARMTGEAGKVDLESVTDLLTTWATHPIARIRKTAGIALREVAKQPSSAPSALALLDDWASDTSSANADNLRWAAAAALGRLASIDPQFGVSDQALTTLQRLGGDSDGTVAAAVAQAFRMMGAALPVQQLGGVLTQLAKRDHFIRHEVARALDEAANRKSGEVYKLLDIWAASQSTNVQKTAIFLLCTARRIPTKEKREILAKFCDRNCLSIFQTLQEIFGDDNEQNKQIARKVISDAVVHSPQLRHRLVVAFARQYEKDNQSTQVLLDGLSENAQPGLFEMQASIHALIPNSAVETLMSRPTVERAGYLAKLLRDGHGAALVSEALTTGTNEGFNWWFADHAIIGKSGEALPVDGSVLEVRNELERINQTLCERKRREIGFVVKQIGDLRLIISQIGFRNFSALDADLSEVDTLCRSDRYRDYLRAETMAQATFSKASSDSQTELERKIHVESAQLKSLNAEKASALLTEDDLKEKARVSRWFIATGVLLPTVLLGILSFYLLVYPTRYVTTNRPAKLFGNVHAAGSTFEVVREQESEVCISLAESTECYGKDIVLQFGEITESYTIGTILLVPLLIVGLIIFWIVLSAVLITLYYGSVKGEEKNRLNSKIRDIQLEIERLAELKARISALDSSSFFEGEEVAPRIALARAAGQV